LLSVLETFFASAEIVFRFLALNSVYSALLAFIVLTIKLAFPRIPRTLEYGLWCLVLIRLVLPTDFSISYSVGYLSHEWFETEIPVVLSSANWLTEFANQTIFVDANSTFTWFKLLLLAWLCVSTIVAIKFISLKFKLNRLLATAHPVEDYWLAKEINYWRRQFNIRRQIIVIDSDDFLSPFTFATLSPVVFIPNQLIEEKNEQVIGPIIAHELAHIKRLDALWLIFQNIVQIIYCLNPVLWLAVRRLNSLREEMCDQKVLDTRKIANDAYGKSLLHVLRLNIGQKSPELFATFFLSHKSVFKKRIAAIGANKALQSKGMFQYAGIALFALFFLPFSWQQTLIEQPISQLEPLKLEIDSPFPEHIRVNYQPPVLLKANKKNKVFEKVELDPL